MTWLLSGALWRRHWLEMRGGFLVASIVTALLCLLFVALVGIGIEDYDVYSRTSPWLRASVDRRAEFGLEPFAAWGAHVATATLAAIFLGLFLHGTGIRTNNLTPGHPSLTYTLTLPVSRPALVWTRFGAAVLAAVIRFGAMLAVNALVLRIAGWPVPLPAMAQASAIALATLLVVIASLGSLPPLWNEAAGYTVMTLVIFAVPLVGWDSIARLIASATPPWFVLAAGAGLVALSLTLAGIVATRKDF